MALKTCPYCAEDIQQDAQKCRYCGEWLSPVTAPTQKLTPQRKAPQGRSKGSCIGCGIILVFFVGFILLITEQTSQKARTDSELAERMLQHSDGRMRKHLDALSATAESSGSWELKQQVDDLQSAYDRYERETDPQRKLQEHQNFTQKLNQLDSNIQRTP